MKVLTLTQPWASLVALGAKRIETRSWTTSYRGPLYIHAAKGFPEDARDLCSDKLWSRCLKGIPWTELPRGAILATARLADVVSTNEGRIRFPYRILEEPWDAPRSQEQLEAEFGNFTAGRFAWFLEDVQVLPEPIPAKGSLGLWEYPAVDQTHRPTTGDLFAPERP